MKRPGISLSTHWLRVGTLMCLCAGWSVSSGHAMDPTPARQSELRALVIQDCGSCHGMTLKGGLGSALLPGDLDGVEAATIAEIVLDGVPGTPMPPWRGLLSRNDALWIGEALKTGEFK